MRKPDARLVMAAATALVLWNACADDRGLSAGRDGSAGSTGGATAGTGGATPGTGGSQSGAGGATATGGTTHGAGGATATGGFIATGGTKSGSGGVTAAGGATMTGGSGSGGLPGTGGKVGGAGGSAMDAGTTKDVGRDFVCPPVCAIYCPYGNVLDDNGCATCSCKGLPADASTDTLRIEAGVCQSLVCPPIFCDYGYANDPYGCPTCKCNPDPNDCPAIKCMACPFGYLKDAQGCDTCDCAPDPGNACADISNESTCAATAGRCRWLVPGCGEPALPAAGCYDETFIDCTSTCPSGRSCLQRSINPCYNLDCQACGQQIGICL